MSNKLVKIDSKLSDAASSVQAKLNNAASKAALDIIELPPIFNQLVIFILDGSGSMTWKSISGKPKATEVHEGVVDVLSRLKKSKNKNCFDVAFWAYGNETKVMLQTTNVTKLVFANEREQFNPCLYLSDKRYTILLDALKEAKNLSENYLNSHKNKQVQVLFLILSDGVINDYNDAFSFMDKEIKTDNRVFISGIFFEGVQSEAHYSNEEQQQGAANLASLSSPGMFTKIVDPEEIRKHMLKSISMISGVHP